MQLPMKDLLLVVLWYVFVNPIDTTEQLVFTTQRVPWTYPCSPTATFVVTEMVTVATVATTEPTVMAVDILIEKNLRLKRLARRIRNKMILRFNDSSITSELQRLDVPGFPRANSSSTQNVTTVYRDYFTDLSKAAVYLEQVYTDEDQRQMKRRLNSLFLENISQLCELQLALQVANVFHSENIQRDILPDSLHRTNTTYGRYTRDFLIVTRYTDLLAAHHYQYTRLKNTA